MKGLSEQLKELSDKGVDEKEHKEYLRQILELLKKEELYAKFSKYEFWIPKFKPRYAVSSLMDMAYG
nr:putative reverse transcriptase domain-containing protein [Tanacetum cinerariifolium]